MCRARLLNTLLLAVLVVVATTGLAAAQCTLDFSLPFTTQCGATFEGGLIPQYWWTACGNGFSFNTPDNLYITIPGGAYRIDVRIEAIHGGGQAIMYFQDANRMPLPDPIISEEGCGSAVTQSRVFEVPVHYIQVSLINVRLIENEALLSAMTIWEGPVAIEPTTWGRVKAMYRTQLQ